MIPTSTRLSYANGYLDLGMLRQAAAELDAIEEGHRLRPDVLSLRAKYYLEAKNWELMEAVSRQLVSAKPDVALGWVHLAYALRELNRNAEAKEIALKGLKHHPQAAVLWYNLACYCSLLGQFPEAAKHLQKAVSLDDSFEDEAAQDPDLAPLRRFTEQNPDN